MTRIAVFLATAGYSGYFPIPPGTVGSAVGVVVYGALRWAQSPVSPATEAVLVLCLFAAGVWAGTTAERYFGGVDPGPIVLDEVVGMLNIKVDGVNMTPENVLTIIRSILEADVKK